MISSIPGTDEAERRTEQYYMELRTTFTEKMMLKEQNWEVISDRSHCIQQGIEACNGVFLENYE